MDAGTRHTGTGRWVRCSIRVRPLPAVRAQALGILTVVIRSEHVALGRQEVVLDRTLDELDYIVSISQNRPDSLIVPKIDDSVSPSP